MYRRDATTHSCTSGGCDVDSLNSRLNAGPLRAAGGGDEFNRTGNTNNYYRYSISPRINRRLKDLVRVTRECLYLGKPILALPELGQDEQAINGVLLERMEGGEACRPDRLTADVLRSFLAERDRFGESIDREFAHGLPAAETALESVLESL